MKLNNIFSVNTSNSGGKKLFKKIINKYNLGTEYKKLSEGIKDSNNVVGGDVGGFRYESTKVCYRISPGSEDSTRQAILNLLSICPLYSAVHEYVNHGNYTIYTKYNLFTSSAAVLQVALNDNTNNYLYVEECKFELNLDFSDGNIFCAKSIVDFISPGTHISDEDLANIYGIERVPYDDYMNLRVSQEIGKELIN